MSRVLTLASFLLAAPLAAQHNPFAFTSGSVKSAYMLYEITNAASPGAVGTLEVGVTKERWVMRSSSLVEMAGRKDTLSIVSIETPDSVYNLVDREAQVSPSLRSFLIREYEALDAAGKARLRQNLELLGTLEGDDDIKRLAWPSGQTKTGSRTVAGHRCDVYEASGSTVCVLPEAPMIFLAGTSPDGMSSLARKVVLNGEMPPAMMVLPRGVRWKKNSDYDDEFDFVLKIWTTKKESDPAETSPAVLVQFALRYLASPEATTELRERQQGAPDAP